jgi:hypothetical protein
MKHIPRRAQSAGLVISVLCAPYAAPGAQSRYPLPPIPFEDRGACPFEGCTYLKALGREIQIRPGETLYLLTYQGEGFSKVWLRGKLFTDVDTTEFLNGVCEEQPSRCKGTIVEPSRTEWWIQIRHRQGRVGWTLEHQKFDGKDALG